MRVALGRLHVQEAFRAGTARLVDHHHGLLHQVVLGDHALDQPRHLVGTAAGAREPCVIPGALLETAVRTLVAMPGVRRSAEENKPFARRDGQRHVLMAGEKVLELVLQLFGRRAFSRFHERMSDNRALQREFFMLAALQKPQVDGIDRPGHGKRSDQSLQRQPPGEARPK